MARKVKIYHGGEVRWPGSCAHCRQKTDLLTADASIGRISKIGASFGEDEEDEEEEGGPEVTVTGELSRFSYPVCRSHAKGLTAADWATRKSLGLKVLRGMVWILGPLSLLFMVLAFPLALYNSLKSGEPMSISWVMIGIYALFAVAFIQLLRAYGKLPLRLVSVTADTTTIKFRNNIYAREFARLNRDIVIE